MLQNQPLPVGYIILSNGVIIGPRSKGNPRKMHPNQMGYLRFKANVGRRSRTYMVHKLVCRVFHGPPPEWAECVRHLDGNNTNNHASNLCWGTNAENGRDRAKHGIDNQPYGSRHGLAKLTESDIPVIRRMISEGQGDTEIGRQFEVSRTTIRNIRLGKIWTHVVQ